MPSPTPAGPRVRVVGLDLMDTLIVDPYREAIVAGTGLSLIEAAAERRDGLWVDFELDRLEEAEYARLFFRDGSAHRLDLSAFKAALTRGYRFVPGMETLTTRVAERWPVHVLSNYPRWYEQIRRQFDLDRFVAAHHPSYVLGARKPDPDFFRRALDRIGVEPQELLFVDDRSENVDAAAQLGMPALLFESAERLESDLAGWLL